MPKRLAFMVMAATNHVDKIDAALIRPGRFDHIVTLDYPTLALLPAALRWQLGSDLPDADLSGVAVQAVGASGADIAAAVRAARARARKARRDLSLTDLEEALAAARPALPDALRWRVSPNPFDPKRFRMSSDSQQGPAAQKVLTNLGVRKPTRQQFVRVNPNPELRLVCGLLELDGQPRPYLVLPEFAHLLGTDIKERELRLASSYA